jgi:hypothetical protein
MKQCWSEGELRSYLDGELPSEDLARVAAHLAGCGACAASAAVLSARSQRVSTLLSELGELGELGLGGAGASAGLPVKHSRPRWIPAAAALAACLALAFVLLPKRATHPVIPTAAVSAPRAAVTVPEVPRVAQAAPPARPHKRPQPRKPEIHYFLALDDEPFEVGVVRRVALGPQEILADVVFSPDGRARAIRLLSDPEN